MEMSESAQMLRDIGENKPIRIPYQIQGDGQIQRIITAFGNARLAAKYFERVDNAEAPEKDE